MIQDNNSFRVATDMVMPNWNEKCASSGSGGPRNVWVPNWPSTVVTRGPQHSATLYALQRAVAELGYCQAPVRPGFNHAPPGPGCPRAGRVTSGAGTTPRHSAPTCAPISRSTWPRPDDPMRLASLGQQPGQRREHLGPPTTVVGGGPGDATLPPHAGAPESPRSSIVSYGPVARTSP